MSIGVPLVRSLAWAAGGAAMLVAEQARRIQRARRLLAQAPAVYTRLHEGAAQRVLLVGDSTGAGVGCCAPDESLAAQLARDFPQAEVRNLCRAGATVADVLASVRALPAAPRFDLVLVFAGGNDILQRTPPDVLQQQVDALLGELRSRSRSLLWAGIANVGLAPLFLPPFSWWMSWSTRRINRLLARRVAAAGGRFVDFYRDRGHDPFSAEPARFYAADRVHPSARAYAWCYARMKPAIATALAGTPVRA
jgi:lysophospholipase L1-like esterase